MHFLSPLISFTSLRLLPSFTFYIIFLHFILLVGVASCLPGLRRRRDSSPDFFELLSNASLILGSITSGFGCSDLPYGYYADEANNCAIFHVCLPYIDFGQIITR
ncbi:hypothetical protein Hamer_G015702 [Homarus americanus]|uniref:Uncharacterized protein n=1 Tax=Homarus americanus TaxID=6706 RepID=A0A8J5JL19_HOMAM|nr:hypothetical protein Hamer_G015702 [Homarus americanus]